MQIAPVSPEQQAQRYFEHDAYESLAAITQQDLAATPLYLEKTWGPTDVAAVKRFFIDAAPLANPKLMGNFWETEQLASLYARVLADKMGLPELNPDEAEALNLMHDFGRLMSPDQFYRNDILFERFTHRVGFRDGALDKLPSLKSILGMPGSQSLRSMHDVPPASRLLHVGDWLGKRNADGELVTPDEIINTSNASFDRYRKIARWTSTFAGVDALDHGGLTTGNHLFVDEIDWLKAEGVDLAEVRQDVETLSQSPAAQAWLETVQAANINRPALTQ